MTTAPIKNSSRFWLTTALRALMWCLIIFCLNIFIESSAPAALLYAATISGCTAGSLLARSSLKTLGLFLVIAVGSITIKLLSWIFFSLPLPVDFSIYGLLCSEQISIALVITTITLLTSWTFWRSSLGLALEALLLVATLITTLSAHRNYRFDLIKLINDLAWDYHISPLAMIIIIAAVFIALICLYLYSQNLTGRPQLGRELPIFSQRLKTQLIPLILICSTLIGLSTFTAYQVFQYHQKISATQLSSGVGQEEKEGLSPLTFHQSLGKSNEPMALMRLDSEYLNNPDSPMLYLRETALSKIRGHEMVIAPEEFDRDVPRISPGQTFLRKEEIESEAVERSEIIQSIYLITKHKLLFGIDIPTRYSLLNLPQNSKRFKAAFRAYSMVPHYDRQILQELNVGDPTWTPETIRHYTEGHKDPRYREMALRITAGLENKSHQALRVIEYLSKNAIYTLTPNHKGGSKDDQTAEFLFGDMRGYCVHFAHASVFLLRALGIPARVASGYMNDLSKSRDGHLLLRASDRHAWAEVYFEGIGWVPLDTEPEHVESHADSPIDMDLLDQLMSEIGPDSELLPDLAEDSFPKEDRNNRFTIEGATLLKFLGLILIGLTTLLVSCKILLRNSWRLSKNPRVRLARLYRATVSKLHDLGLSRTRAETRTQYRERIKVALGQDLLVLTPEVLELLYNPEPKILQSTSERALQEYQRLNQLLPRKQRLLSLLSPRSALNYILRRGW